MFEDENKKNNNELKENIKELLRSWLETGESICPGLRLVNA